MSVFVDAAVPFLLNFLSQLIKDEVELLRGVADKVEFLEKELEIVNGFLQDTEGMRSNHEVKAVINQITEDVIEAQDVIDNYIAYKVKQGRRNLLGRAFNAIDYGRILHDVNDKIEKLSGRINDIYNNHNKYGIRKGESAKVERREDESVRKLRENVEEDDVVGFDEYAKDVIKMLKEGSSRNEIVSIVGMGGLGKTTLARKIYKDDQVKSHFDYCMWAYVSESFKPKDVLLSLLRCLKSIPEDKIMNSKASNESGNQSEEDLVGSLKMMLQKNLKGAKYLVVLDDIWKVQVWNEIKDAFPDANNGSRILITSRELALHSGTCGPYHLPPLSEGDSWKLFCKKVFGEEDGCPEELKDAAEKMVKKCKGLPLSIVVLAGLLQRKERSEVYWTNLNKDVISKIAEDKERRVKDILRLSYDNLPRRLKPCFLYLGIYPEDYEIPVRQLIHQWIAEGLIEPNQKKSLEEVADEDYLEELVSRNLVQVASKRTDGGAKTCRIHDHLRELCMSEAKEDKFFEIRTRNDVDVTGKPRRLSVHCSIPSYTSATTCDHSITRSFFCFGQQDQVSFDYGSWKWFAKHMKLIRVLNIGQVRNFNFHAKLEKLILLRYLRVDAKYEFYLQDYITELWNLETLDMRKCSAYSWSPNNLWRLKRLRHLYLCGNLNLPNLSERQILWNLQTLRNVSLTRKNMLQLEKGRFPNLRKLGLELSEEEDRHRLVLEKLQCLEHLNTLKIIRPPEFAKSDRFPRNLTKLTLERVIYCLEENSMKVLGNLPIQILKIRGCKNPRKSKCLRVPEGFKQLQVLEMTSLGNQNWELGPTAMPKLRRLVIKRCEYFTQLPDHLCSSTTTLREVEICSEMDELLENLEKVKKICKFTVKD